MEHLSKLLESLQAPTNDAERVVWELTDCEPSGKRRASPAGIEWLFAEFSALYGTNLASMWRGTDLTRVKQVWAESLGMSTRADILRGVEWCKANGKPWPPNLPEFIAACRNAINFEGLFAAAQGLAIRRTYYSDDVWPSRALYWAAVDFGFYDLRQMSWQQAATQWTRILTAKTLQEAKLDPVPAAALALPAPGAAETSKDRARQHLAGILALAKGRQQQVVA